MSAIEVILTIATITLIIIISMAVMVFMRLDDKLCDFIAKKIKEFRQGKK